MAAILAQNQALVPPFSLFHEPPYVPGSGGVALPRPDADTVVCIAPGDATTRNKNWGQELTLRRGDPHVALAPDDHYPNQVLARDNKLVGPLDKHDPRAQTLLDFWVQAGFTREDIQSAWQEYLETFDKRRRPEWVPQVRYAVSQGQVFFLAKKTQPVLVRGIVDLRFQTSEGPTGLEHGTHIVTHPDDPTNTWALRPEKFEERYNWVDLPNGLVLPESR